MATYIKQKPEEIFPILSEEDLGFGWSEKDITKYSIWLWSRSSFMRGHLESWRDAVSHGWFVYMQTVNTFCSSFGKFSTLFAANYRLLLLRERSKKLIVRVPPHAIQKGHKAEAVEFQLNYHDSFVDEQDYCNDSDMERYLLWFAVSTLNDREKEIMQRRHGLFGEKQEILQILAKDLGVSRERVRQLQLIAESKVKKILIKEHII